MQLFYWPLKTPCIITQRFGENLACVSTDGKTVVTRLEGQPCPSGYRSVYSTMKGHNGLDLHANRYQPVYAAREGVVVEKSTETERGLGISILHGPYGGKYYKTRYWHLAGIEVSLGDRVRTGQLVGFADSTGYSSGDHLHFEVKETDAQGNTINNDNGYFGAIDPLPLMFPQEASRIFTLSTMVEALRAAVQAIADTLAKRTGRG